MTAWWRLADTVEKGRTRRGGSQARGGLGGDGRANQKHCKEVRGFAVSERKKTQEHGKESPSHL